MDTLMNIWYVFSGLIGTILALLSFVLFLIVPPTIIICTCEAIKERHWGDFKFIGLGAIITLIICCCTYGINYAVTKENNLVSEEVPNIRAYEGVGNEKNGKYTNNYFYFKQGVNNDYIEYKVEQNKAHRHDTMNGSVRVVLSHIEYTSPFRYFGIAFLLDSPEYIDVYIPKEK